jgi:tuberculosinol/isotuberculosinol synthase
MDPFILPMSAPQLSEWLRWPTERVARWITAGFQPVVMGWPFNGTRRWYLAYRRQDLNARDYLTTLTRRQAELNRMIFAHGIDTILTPLFGSKLLGRGSAYTQYVFSGLSQLADDEVYQEMFAAGVRIRFYGDYEEMLDAPIFRPTLEACASLAAATASGNGPTLLIGLFADSPHATLARLSVEFAQRWGRPPDRRELIEAYYGLAVPDLSIYLGFAQPVLFDIPLLATGQEDLYVTLNPSPSLTEKQLREILYDHLVTRRVPEVDYDKLPDEAQDALAEYYKRCSGVTMGIGLIDPLTGVWKPLPLVPTGGRQGDPGVPPWDTP